MRYTYFITGSVIPLIAVTIIALMLSHPVSAGEWRGEGTPLYIVAEGSINGSVLVEGGHGYTMENPYVEYFDLPEGIEYARLYIPVWNYNEDDWLEVSINDESLGKRSVPDYVAAWGVATYVYTVTDRVSGGMNQVSVAYHNENGAPYSIVLIAVSKDSALPQTRFWIAEGNNALSDATKKDIGMVEFKGDVPAEASKATLWTMIIAGNYGENDTLHFNSNLLGIDVGRGKSGAYFDLDRWDVTKLMNITSSNTTGNNVTNTVVFDRGDEAYIHPMIAVLSVCCQSGQKEEYLTINNQTESNGGRIPIPVIAVLAVSIIFFAYMVVRKK